MTYYLKIKKIQNQSKIFPDEDAVTTDRNDKILTRKKYVENISFKCKQIILIYIYSTLHNKYIERYTVESNALPEHSEVQLKIRPKRYLEKAQICTLQNFPWVNEKQQGNLKENMLY